MATIREVYLAPLTAPEAPSLSALAKIALPASRSGRYIDGQASGSRLIYFSLNSFVWWDAPRLDAPVRVRLAERLDGLFTDPTLELTFLQNVQLELGTKYRIGDELDPSVDLYTFTIVDKVESEGLVTYVGETLLGELARTRPREPLVLVPGVDDTPNPLTPREALIRFFEHYRIPYNPDIPEFFIRTPQGGFLPDLPALVVDPDPQDAEPPSLYQWLEDLFGPFSSYAFRANAANELEVTPAPWIETAGIVLVNRLYRSSSWKNTVAIRPWIYPDRPPTVRVEQRTDGQLHTVEAELEDAVPLIVVNPYHAELTTTASYDASAGTVTLASESTPTTPTDVEVYGTFRPAARNTAYSLALTQADLAPSGARRLSADEVINQAEYVVQGYSFTPGEPVMEPSVLALRSSQAQLADLTRTVIGPAAAPSADDEGGSFRVLADQEGRLLVASWYVDQSATLRPGSKINVQLDIAEWVTPWHASTGLQAPVLDLERTVEFGLPTDGADHLMAELVYDYGVGSTIQAASGKVYGQYIGGATPMIRVVVQHEPVGAIVPFPVGSPEYHLWGVEIKLTGTGTKYQRSGEAFSVRFGYSQTGELWEGDVDLPGLLDSQQRYKLRPKSFSSGIYQFTEDTAFRIVRAIVEDGFNPKAVYTLEIVPSGPSGYRLKPWYVGRVVLLPWGELGVVRSWEYLENHEGGDSSSVQVEIEVAEPLTRARAVTRTYGTSAYRISHYAPATLELPDVEPAPPPNAEEPPPVEPPPPGALIALTIDPTFVPGNYHWRDGTPFSALEVSWYDECIAVMERIKRGEAPFDTSPLKQMANGNQYDIGRNIHHMTTGGWFILFLVSGDRRVYDFLDSIYQTGRGTLKAQWEDGTNYGYLRWLYRYSTDISSVQGTDWYDRDSIHGYKASTHVGIMVEIYQANAGASVTSYARPSRETDPGLIANHSTVPKPPHWGSIGYTAAYVPLPALQAKTETTGADRAEFWLWYLRNNQEAKWRARTGVAFPEHPWLRSEGHPQHSSAFTWLQLYRITGEAGYRQAGDPIMTDFVAEHVRYSSSNRQNTGTIPTQGVVWRREPPTYDYLYPSTYARYIQMEELYMHLVHRPDTAMIRAITAGIRYWMIDTTTHLHRDCGGGYPKGGVAASPTSWDVENANRISMTHIYHLFAAFDDAILAHSEAVWNSNSNAKNAPHVPLGIFLGKSKKLRSLI